MVERLPLEQVLGAAGVQSCGWRSGGRRGLRGPGGLGLRARLRLLLPGLRAHVAGLPQALLHCVLELPRHVLQLPGELPGIPAFWGRAKQWDKFIIPLEMPKKEETIKLSSMPLPQPKQSLPGTIVCKSFRVALSSF